MVNRMYGNLPGNMQTRDFKVLTDVFSEADNKLDQDIEVFLKKPEDNDVIRKKKSMEILGHEHGSWEEIYSKIPSFYKFYFTSDFLEKIKSFVNVLYYTHIDYLTAFMLVESINLDVYKFIYSLVPPGCDLVLLTKSSAKKLYGGFYIGQPTILSNVEMADVVRFTNAINKDLVFHPHGAILDSETINVDLTNNKFSLGEDAVVRLIALENLGQLSVQVIPDHGDLQIYINSNIYTGGMIDVMEPYMTIEVTGSNIEFEKIIVRMEG